MRTPIERLSKFAKPWVLAEGLCSDTSLKSGMNSHVEPIAFLIFFLLDPRL